MMKIFLMGFALLSQALMPPSAPSAPQGAAYSPLAVVRAIYEWYGRSGEKYSERIAEPQSLFTPELFALLQKAFAADADAAAAMLDFDPFVDAQVPAARITFSAERIEGTDAGVPVKVEFQGGESRVFTVRLIKGETGWRVANFMYEQNTDLVSYLTRRKTPSLKPLGESTC